MSTHAPGPWEMAGPVGLASWIQSETRSNIAAVHGAYTDEGIANARLIATAPEMYAVLDELEGSFDQQTYQEQARAEFDAPDDREYSVNITAKQLRAITRVLNKAQGRR